MRKCHANARDCVSLEICCNTFVNFAQNNILKKSIFFAISSARRQWKNSHWTTIWKQQVFDTDVWRNWLWLLTKSADFFFFLFYLKSSHSYVILDWSYNYHASNMYQQVAPTEIYVKNKNNKQTNKQNKKQQPYLQPRNNRKNYIHLCLYPY